MNKIFILITLIFYSFSLSSQQNMLIDLIHGVDYYTDGWGEDDINFYDAFHDFNISYLEKSDISLDVEIVNENQMGEQQIIYNIDLPTQEELESVKALYVISSRESSDNFSNILGILYNPEGEIVSEMFNGLIHFDNAYGPGWQIELNLNLPVEYNIIIGYGNVLFDSELAQGQINLTEFDVAIRIVDETYSAFNGNPEDYSEYEIQALSNAFEDTLGFMNIYNFQDVYWAKPFIHFDFNKNAAIDFEVFLPGTKTMAEPNPLISNRNLIWNNFQIEENQKNEIVYEAAFDSRLNFINFDISGSTIQIENQIPYNLDNIFVFRYTEKNKYILYKTDILQALSDQILIYSEEYSTSELIKYLKNIFYTTAIDNGFNNGEAEHFINDFFWIESLLKKSRDYPKDFFGFYHFNGELYDKLVPHNCTPTPEKVERNAWVMLLNIINREKEKVIKFPWGYSKNESYNVLSGLILREYGVVYEHYTRSLNNREDIFNVELGQYLNLEDYFYPPIFYDNQISNMLSQYVEQSLFLDNGEYSFIVNNPTEQGILHLAYQDLPTAVLSTVGENGIVISLGSAGIFANESDNHQFTTNCANYLTGNDIVQVNSEDVLYPKMEYSLNHNYPNPFNPSTNISFTIPKGSQVQLYVYNIKGQMIKTLVNDQFPAGKHSVIWYGIDDSGKAIDSGIYLYKLIVDDQIEFSKKCMLLK